MFTQKPEKIEIGVNKAKRAISKRMLEWNEEISSLLVHHGARASVEIFFIKVRIARLHKIITESTSRLSCVELYKSKASDVLYEDYGLIRDLIKAYAKEEGINTIELTEIFKNKNPKLNLDDKSDNQSVDAKSVHSSLCRL